jgi:hypothetical protein
VNLDVFNICYNGAMDTENRSELNINGVVLSDWWHYSHFPTTLRTNTLGDSTGTDFRGLEYIFTVGLQACATGVRWAQKTGQNSISTALFWAIGGIIRTYRQRSERIRWAIPLEPIFGVWSIVSLWACRHAPQWCDGHRKQVRTQYQRRCFERLVA